MATQTIPVRAKARGYYANSLREPGATFTISSAKELGKWMERIDEPKPEKEKEPAKGKEKDPKDKEPAAAPPPVI